METMNRRTVSAAIIILAGFLLQACGPVSVSAIQTAYAGTITSAAATQERAVEQVIAMKTNVAGTCTGIEYPWVSEAGDTYSPNYVVQEVIGEFVWVDTNGNNLQDVGEPGAPGVTVELWDGRMENLLGTTYTNSFGYYFFCVKNPQDYVFRLHFVAPDGYAFVDQSYHNRGIDSNADSMGWTDPFGHSPSHVSNLDAGLRLIEITATPTTNGEQSTGTYVTIADDVNCRSGPGTQYSVVDTLGAGQSAEVVAVLPNSEYVVIKLPDGRKCWLWTKYADKQDFSGDGLPAATQPPTPTPGPTQTPKPTKTPTPTPTPSVTPSPTITQEIK